MRKHSDRPNHKPVRRPMADTAVPISKMCVNCHARKSASEFHKNRSKQDGLNRICKACNIEKAKLWAEKNPERARAKSLKFYRANRDRLLKRFAENRAINKDRDKRTQKAWREANKERKRANDLRWQQAHQEKMRLFRRISEHRRRAAKLKSSGHYTKSDVERLYLHQRCRCACCRKSIKDGYEIDHIAPLSRGGDNRIRNIQLLCPRCNGKKSAKDPIVFMQEMGFLI
jgi:5-methylcytosine-specific restriction endonuclease McrA